MNQLRPSEKADRMNPAIAWTAAFSQAAAASLARAGNWAASTAQESGSVVAALMGPAVLSAYAFAFWSLTADMGWTSSFPFKAGALSSWIVWLAFAAALHWAAFVLRRHQDRS